MKRFERKTDAEKAADAILAEDTKKRGSGMTRYVRTPAREVLSEDMAVYGTDAAHYDEYPSDQPALADQNIRMRYLSAMVSKLSPRQQECIQHVVIGGLSERAAGEILGVSGGTVSKHLQAAMKKLRESAAGDELFQILFKGLTD